ncbi:hypothetical protein, partial [Klebsiella pneumoniae]|uniref:hypothetical protein n=1 Tax=Klebsiella pneumoniae TaxID=573 RepID=UPI001C701D08
LFDALPLADTVIIKKTNPPASTKKTRPYIVALTQPFCESAQLLRGLKANCIPNNKLRGL